MLGLPLPAERVPFHSLKIWPKYYDMVNSGSKQFELRKNDRDFRQGDILWLREYDPDAQQYTGYSKIVHVGSLFTASDMPGIAEGYVLMGIDHL